MRHCSKTRVWLAGTVMFAVSCAEIDGDVDSPAEVPSSTAATSIEQQLTEKAAALGFDTADIVIGDNFVRVEGDIVLDRDGLLNGGYDHPPSSGTTVEKGYRTPSLISAANDGNVRLQWLTASNPSTTFRNAFISAAGDFNSIFSSLYVSQNNTGPAITVGTIPAASWPGNTNCAPTDASCAYFPSNGNPGVAIWVKDSQPGPGCAAWSSDALANRARHELGHAVGLHHVAVGQYIPGTQGCTASTQAACLQTPGYPTVMVKTAQCTGNMTTLATDDRNSIAALYP